MLLLGGLLLHLTVCGALTISPAAPLSQDGLYEAARTIEDQEAIINDKVVPRSCFSCSCLTTIYSFFRDTFRLGLFSSISFWLVVFTVCVWRMTCSAWIIYFVQYSTVYKDFTLEDTSQFIVSYGIGRLAACVVISPLVDSVQVVSTYTWLAIAQLLVAVYYAVDPWLISYWAMMANAFVYGNAFAMSSVLKDVATKKVFGKEQMGHAMGLLGTAAGSTILLLLYFPGEFMSLSAEITLTILKKSFTIKHIILLKHNFGMSNCGNNHRVHDCKPMSREACKLLLQ